MAMGLVGCGSVVIPPDGEGGGGAEGGLGGVANVPSTPSECPLGGIAPNDECAVLDLSCAYAEENGCSVTYVCECVGDLIDNTCESFARWQPTSASCDPSAVDCQNANDGDTCAVPDEYCYIADAGECMSEDRWCDESHLWHVYRYQPFEPFCPDALPIAGGECDACNDAAECSYTVEAECGPASVTAGCSPDSALWQITEPICEPPEPG